MTYDDPDLPASSDVEDVDMDIADDDISAGGVPGVVPIDACIPWSGDDQMRVVVFLRSSSFPWRLAVVRFPRPWRLGLICVLRRFPV
jgi:hypothetical protein